jgi:putative membrane protein
MKNIVVLLKGFVMGISEVIPGVSGSTLALVMGIYKKFISFLYQISNVVKEIVKLLIFKSNFEKLKLVLKKVNIKFGIFLFLGMGLAIASLSNVLGYLLEEYREYVLAFFFGLVLASVMVPWGAIEKKTYKEILIVVVSLVIFLFVLSINPYTMTQVPHPLYFFFGGAVAICAMVLPGVSGSFVFLMLGIYEFIVQHIRNFTRLESTTSEIVNLVFLAFGILFGFTIFVRILRYGLKNHSSKIFAILTGIILASTKVLWPYNGTTDMRKILALSFVAMIGFLIVLILRKCNEKENLNNL